jgi:hypothetical protein
MRPNEKKKSIKLLETAFDIAYLGTVLISAALLLANANTGSERWRFGLMALILGVGDAFHLIPRIYAMWAGGASDRTALLGVGKMIASVTMTVFYVVLWGVGAIRYADIVPAHIGAVVTALAALRVALCLFPQNRWTSGEASLTWAVLRNAPFFALGMLVMALFAAGSRISGGFPLLWLAVLLSFVCYLPVVLFSRRAPKVGMLMLPKSCAYAAIVLMGFSLSGV